MADTPAETVTDPTTAPAASVRGGAQGASRVVATIGIIAVAAAATVTVLRPSLGPLVGGTVLLAVGFAVMAPCSIQMALTMSLVVRRTHGEGSRTIRRTAGWFALGYLGFYLPVALVLGGVARLLGDLAWIAVALGAIASLVLGLATLGVVDLGALSRCRGPLWLLRTGRASFHRPVRAGAAFGQYCATCCGPYVLALAVLAGGTRDFAVGAGLVVAYAVLMALPFLAPAILAPATYTELGAVANRLAPRIDKITGVVLVGLSLALVPAVIGAM